MICFSGRREMTGFIRGLFGKKEKAPKESKEAFFLDDDSAKSLGNLEYMRKPSTVRRTFPKTVSSPEKKEYTQETSAMDKVYVQSQGKIPLAGGIKPKVRGNGQIQPKTISQSSFVAPSAPQAPAAVPEPAAPDPAATTPEPSQAVSEEKPQPSFKPQPADTAKRTPDSNMDMFRNMAKKMR